MTVGSKFEDVRSSVRDRIEEGWSTARGVQIPDYSKGGGRNKSGHVLDLRSGECAMPKPDEAMTKPDADIDIIDDTIMKVVLAHQWEIFDGIKINNEDDIVLECSCGLLVVVVAHDAINVLLETEPPGMGLRRARRAHQAHLIEALGCAS
jgi:hypothetical protein